MSGYTPFPAFAGQVARSPLFRVTIEGEAVDVLPANGAHVAIFPCLGPLEIAVQGFDPRLLPPSVGGTPRRGEGWQPPPPQIELKPLARGLRGQWRGDALLLTLPGPGHYALEAPGVAPLLLRAMAPDPRAPAIGAAKVRRFAAGEVHRVGELRMESGETVYLEPGAMVDGVIRGTRADGARVAGRGVLRSGGAATEVSGHRGIVFEGSHCCMLEGITQLDARSWSTVFGNCEGVWVRDYATIGAGAGRDGIDIVGCRDTIVDGCLVASGDDCLAVKSLDVRAHSNDARESWEGEVSNVHFSRCVLLKLTCGSAMEIGHELRTDRIRGVVFRDIDVLGSHHFGAICSINNADRATVEQIVWDDIRVEHYYHHLIHFRIVRSRWSEDERRGHIRQVVLRKLRIRQSIYNPGYSSSLIGGWSPEFRVDDVLLEDIQIDGRPVRDADALDLFCKQARNVRFG